MNLRFVHLVYATLAIQLISFGGAAQGYWIRLDHPERVGEKYLLVTTTSENVRTDITVDGRIAESSAEGFTIELSAWVTIIAINANNWATRKSFAIVSSRLTKGSGSGPLLPEGTVVTLLLENGRSVYQVSGKPVADEVAKGLGAVISLHTAGTADDGMFGTKARKKVGESWQVDIDATAALLKDMGVSGTPQISGTGILEKVAKNQIFVRSSVKVQGALLPIMTGITTDTGEIHLEFSGRFPLLPSDISRDVTDGIYMSRSGTGVTTDRKTVKVSVIYERKSHYEIRPMRF